MLRHPYLRALGNGMLWAATPLFIVDHVVCGRKFTGSSMYPFINTDYHSSTHSDYALIDRWRPCAGLQRGMIVAFWSPQDPTKELGKRIIALEGDEVITRPPYPKRREVVPEGHVWVEGDNADPRKTIDSNWFGPIPKNLIIGKVRAVVWPHVHRISHKDYAGSPRVSPNKHKIDKAERWDGDIPSA